MDELLDQLQKRFPRMEWRKEGGHYEGQRDQIVVTRSASAVEAVEKLAAEAQLSAALSGLPAEPEEWGSPNMPGPAGLGCPAVAALMGLAGVAVLALWMGMELVRWVTQ